MTAKVDRFDPAHLAHWHARYARAARDYADGSSSRIDAEMTLHELGFRGEALKIESLVWAGLRDTQNKRKGKF